MHAQTEKPNPPISNEDFFKQAELVFEGYFLRYVDSYDTKGEGKSKDCITVSAYKVTRVYKGDPSLTGEVVYTAISGYALGLENLYAGNTTTSYWTPYTFRRNGINQDVSAFSPRIFFFVSSDLPDNENSKYFSHKKYKHLRECFKGNIDDVYVYKDKVLGLNNLVFHNREDFYNYMKQFEGFTVPEVESQKEKEVEKPLENKPYNKAEIDSLHKDAIQKKWGDHKKKL